MELGLAWMSTKALREFLSQEQNTNLSKALCLLLMVSTLNAWKIQTSFIESIVEPGYYEDGSFGIRIENVELIKKVETKYNSGISNLTMEPLTLVRDHVTFNPMPLHGLSLTGSDPAKNDHGFSP